MYEDLPIISKEEKKEIDRQWYRDSLLQAVGYRGGDNPRPGNLPTPKRPKLSPKRDGGKAADANSRKYQAKGYRGGDNVDPGASPPAHLPKKRLSWTQDWYNFGGYENVDGQIAVRAAEEAAREKERRRAPLSSGSTGGWFGWGGFRGQDNPRPFEDLPAPHKPRLRKSGGRSDADDIDEEPVHVPLPKETTYTKRSAAKKEKVAAPEPWEFYERQRDGF